MGHGTIYLVPISKLPLGFRVVLYQSRSEIEIIQIYMASDNTLTNKRIRLRIPQNYHQEPVISRLVSDYGLTVNITAAILGANAVGDGWFDLELQGTDAQIQSGLTYLRDLELEVWDDTKASDW